MDADDAKDRDRIAALTDAEVKAELLAHGIDPAVAQDRVLKAVRRHGRRCLVCGGTPVIPEVGLCGPCCLGEAATGEG